MITRDTTSPIPYDVIGGDITPGTNRFIDMHFFDVVDAQPGDLFVIAAQTYPGQVYAGVNGISFDVLKDPGDYNADGTVNAADYTSWRNTLGDGLKAGSPGRRRQQQRSGCRRLHVWKNNFGNVTPGSGGGAGGLGVPEPASNLLIFAAAAFGWLARGRRRV